MSLLTIFHLAQTLVSAYTGLISYISIRKVQTYEETTEKVAKYSNIADHHLQETRATMTAGATSVIASTSLSLYLLTFPPSPAMCFLLAAGVAGTLTASHTQISNYWRGKAKIPAPGAGDYNDAITTSNQMRSYLGGLAGSWAVAAVWYLTRWVL